MKRKFINKTKEEEKSCSQHNFIEEKIIHLLNNSESHRKAAQKKCGRD